MVATGLVACGAGAKKVNGPDGSGDWYSITCRRTRANCHEKAGDVCPKGYEVSDASEKNSFELGRDLAGNVTAGERYDGQMLVKCKD